MGVGVVLAGVIGFGILSYPISLIFINGESVSTHEEIVFLVTFPIVLVIVMAMLFLYMKRVLHTKKINSFRHILLESLPFLIFALLFVIMGNALQQFWDTVLPAGSDSATLELMIAQFGSTSFATMWFFYVVVSKLSMKKMGNETKRVKN
ncbi:MAG: hypothetical protein ABIG66_01005 [Candidatus Kerfeldbacteria bacterium]